MNSDAANVLQWLMPAFLGCFAVTFLVVAFIARDLKAAFWGGIFFISGGAMLAMQSVLPVGNEWSIFAVGCMLSLTYLFGVKALVARSGKSIPLSVYIASAVGLTICSPLFPFPLTPSYHHALLMAVPSLMLFAFAINRMKWRGTELSDKLLNGSVITLILLPSGAIARMINLNSIWDVHAPADELFLYILHALMGMTGPIFGTTLLLALGVDLVRREGNRAMTDGLTGLRNRHALDQALGAARLGQWRCGAAIVLDLDHFKAVNDDYGHAAGDEVLREVGRMLRRNLGDLAYLYRLGGEEFLILLEEHQAEAASSMALMLRQATAALEFAPAWPDLSVTASIGLSINRDGQSVEDIIAIADEAMYRAKRNGRNRVVAAPDGHDPVAAKAVGVVA